VPYSEPLEGIGKVKQFASIAAVVVEGTSVFGGRGKLIGTLLGAILLVLLQDALNRLHVTAYYQYIWTGHYC
jgi:ribose transport system ATP-binding protein